MSHLPVWHDFLARFNQTIGRLDHAVTQLEKAGKNLTGPVERIAGALGPGVARPAGQVARDPRDAGGAVLSAAERGAARGPPCMKCTDTQGQAALLQTTIERVIGVLSDVPGAGILRRAAARSGSSETAGADGTARPKPRTRR